MRSPPPFGPSLPIFRRGPSAYRHMTVGAVVPRSPCHNGRMLHSLPLSSVAQIPLAAGIVGADPTGLEWLLLVAAPIVFFVIFLACLMVVAAFGPLVMRNNKSGGTT